ncbi:hypothetical protein H2203_006922 [Taxawa tesnikishii (nom. ined.)]|nr:hypothetical protein H2203_006922 [Dothideales sp. JES 119]
MLLNHNANPLNNASRVKLEYVSDDASEEFWGSLPSQLVVSHEIRLEDIQNGLEELDVEGLKDHVLSVHVQPRSQPVSAYEPEQRDYLSSKLQHLDDFTALITATTLQALPHLSRLNRLANTWTCRLAVLRKVPSFLRDLQEAEKSLEGLWNDMTRMLQAAEAPSTEPLREGFASAQKDIERQVAKLGARLDSMLDDLEGREETLPDYWIDRFEALESDYGDWVMQTERRVLDHEWMQSKEAKANANQDDFDAFTEEAAKGNGVSETKEQAVESSEHDSHDYNDVSPLTERDNQLLSQYDINPEDMIQVSPPKKADSPESPVLGARASLPLPRAMSPTGSLDPNRNYPDAGVVSHKPSLVSQGTELTPNHTPDRVDLDNISVAESLPAEEDYGVAITSDDSRPRSGQDFSSLPVQPPVSPRSNRSRHVPITIDYNQEALQVSTEAAQKENRSITVSRQASPLPEAAPESTSEGAVARARAALIKAELEKTQSLQKTKSPDIVRPFEHASQAFTKLFAKSNSTEQSRSSSTSSRTSKRSIFIPGRRLNGGSVRSSAQAIDAGAGRPTPQRVNSSRSMPALESCNAEDEAATRNDVSNEPEQQAHMQVMITPGHNHDASSRPSTPSPPSPTHAVVPEQAGDEDTVEALVNLPKVTTPSSFRSNLSTPEVRDASAAGYFRPKEVHTSPSISRHASVATVRNGQTSPQRPRTADLPRMHIPSSEFNTLAVPSGEPNDEEALDPKKLLTKRVSVTSIESFPRSELKTVNVSRNGSFSSVSPAVTPPGHRRYRSLDITSRSPPSPLSTRADAVGGSPQDSPPASPVSAESPTVGRYRERPSLSVLPDTFRTESEISMNRPPPLNLYLPKRRNMSITSVSSVPEAPSNSDTDSPPSPTSVQPVKRKHQKNSSVTGIDQFDRQVSSVLERLPSSRIRFTPIASAPSSEVPGSPTANDSVTPRPSLSSIRSTQTNSSLILAPATETTPRKPGANPDIKLYHLSQPGRDEPIKLFIRLVGENERVMVRVGGGWADLGEYLRQYAEHHGRRTVSGSGVEIKGATPGNIKTRERAGHVRQPAARQRAEQPQAELRHVPRSPELVSSSPQWSTTVTPHNNGPRVVNEGTPASLSRPSTSTSLENRPGSRQSWVGDEIGLAGPASSKSKGKSKSKRVSELSKEKARWVEEMIERAKAASVEKKKVEEKEKEKGWNDMGKFGSTRRVVFKQAGGGTDKDE